MTFAAPLPCYSVELAIYWVLEDGLRAWLQHCNLGRGVRTQRDATEAVSTCGLAALAIFRASTVPPTTTVARSLNTAHLRKPGVAGAAGCGSGAARARQGGFFRGGPSGK